MSQFKKFVPPQTHAATIDESTGLMWDSAGSAERMTWSDAKVYVASLNIAGYSDWRLPTVRELQGIVDYERHDPAIDREHFPGCKSNYYWSGTPVAASPADCAWCVDFVDGYVGDSVQVNEAFVRAVRSVPSGQS